LTSLGFLLSTQLDHTIAFQQSAINGSGATQAGAIFFAACRIGLEGLVSKRRDRPYQAGLSKHWIVKNRKHSATDRVAESFR
jgi:ATP-dependent DNA ligase